MSLAIEKLIPIIIMIIVIIAIVIILQTPHLFAGELSTEDKLRQCCQKYLARGCPDSYGDIECPCKLVLNPDTLEYETECEGEMWDYAQELGINDANKLRLFCNCP